MTCHHCKRPYASRRPWSKWCGYRCKRAASKELADARSAREWRLDNRFSLPGDGGYSKRRTG